MPIQAQVEPAHCSFQGERIRLTTRPSSPVYDENVYTDDLILWIAKQATNRGNYFGDSFTRNDAELGITVGKRFPLDFHQIVDGEWDDVSVSYGITVRCTSNANDLSMSNISLWRIPDTDTPQGISRQTSQMELRPFATAVSLPMNHARYTGKQVNDRRGAACGSGVIWLCDNIKWW